MVGRRDGQRKEKEGKKKVEERYYWEKNLGRGMEDERWGSGGRRGKK